MLFLCVIIGQGAPVKCGVTTRSEFRVLLRCNLKKILGHIAAMQFVDIDQINGKYIGMQT